MGVRKFTEAVAVRPMNLEEEISQYVDHKTLPKPGEIVDLIKAYVYSQTGEGIIKEESLNTIKSLDDLIERKKGAEKLYLITYRQIAVNTANELLKLEEKYDKKILKLEKMRSDKISEIKRYLEKKSAHRAAEKWVSVGIGAVFSYYLGKFLVEFSGIPKEYIPDATAAAIFGLVGLISFGINKYYMHEMSRVFNKYEKKIHDLEDSLRERKYGLYKRASKLAEFDYMYHIDGVKRIEDPVKKVSKVDGSRKSFRHLLGMVFNYVFK